MIIRQKEIFQYLENEIKLVDPESSSHWNYYHTDFGFKENKFTGLVGFGENKKPYEGLFKLIHFLLQYPFRKIGKKYSKFNELYQLAKKIRRKQNSAFDLDILRQVISLSFFYEKLSEKVEFKNNLTCIIGDGFGSLTTLMLESNFSKKIILINLSKTLLVDLWYIKLCVGDGKFFEYPWKNDDELLIDELCPWHRYNYQKYPPFYKKYDGPVQHRLVRLK